MDKYFNVIKGELTIEGGSDSDSASSENEEKNDDSTTKKGDKSEIRKSSSPKSPKIK